MFDEKELRKAIALMKPNNQLFECRIVYDNKKMLSGYFKDADTLINELKKQNTNEGNVYFTLGNLKEACYSRNQRNKFELNSKTTTSDNDVVGYDWLMVDLDPKRPAGTSSSNEEIEAAKKVGNEIYIFMKNLGFSNPIKAFSGNGFHLMYKIHLANNTDNRNMVEKCLKTLNTFFGNEIVDVDMKNFNQARICKFYGTIAHKGSNTQERPHRLSKILGDYDSVQTTDIGYLKKLCSLYPTETEKPQRYNGYNGENFDIESWMDKYGINYRKSSFSDGDKYILDHCVFDSNHKGKDAVILRGRNGAISYHCFHNSCSDKKWQDVRVLYEPDAYEKKKMQYSQNYYSKPNAQRKEKPVIVAKENEPIFLTAEQIRCCNEPEPEFIPTGIDGFDKLERGLARGDVSVWTGNSGGGKSSIIAEMILNMADKGYSVVSYSGEMTKKKTLKWLHLMAAGKGNIVETNYEGYYAVPLQIQEKIDKWLGDKFLLYDNKYGHNFVAIYEQIEKLLSENPRDVVILDNLMILDISDLSGEELEAQKLFLLKLKELAPKYNCHVICVCHPKKNYGLIRVADVKGSTDVRALADEIVLLHRVNEDFKRGAKEYFDWKDNNSYFDADNLIEIGKSRDGANADKFVELYFERETKRLKNYKTENKIYGWDEAADNISYGFSQLSLGEETPFD